MGAASKASAKANGRRALLGLAGNGSSGGWEVAIDETLDGPEKWFIQIEGPSVSFSFEITSPATVGTMIQFLEQGRQGALRIGGASRTSVRLVHDAEYPEGCFLVVGPSARPCVRFFMSGPDVSHLLGALKQAREDLKPT